MDLTEQLIHLTVTGGKTGQLGHLGKNILLIEPGYSNKYPPLGLMKLAAYHGPFGRGDHVTFVKGQDEAVLAQAWGRVYVTTLFTFEWKRTAQAIDFTIRAAGGQPERVFVGGIAASLMYDAFVSEPRWTGVRFVKGLLDNPPAVSLGLSAVGFLVGSAVAFLMPQTSVRFIGQSALLGMGLAIVGAASPEALARQRTVWEAR